MSKALEKVQLSLKQDQQRLLKKQHTKGLAPQKKAFYDASQLELLEDLDLQDVDKKHKVVFQQLVSQILTINRSFTTGIRRSDLKEWHEMSKFRPATSEDHQHFVGQVLSNAQLMAQSSRAMRAVHESLLTGAEELNEKPLDRVQLLSFLAKAVHDMKLCTAHLCWHDFVKPLRERKDELELGLQRLRTQLRMTRETYLKEVSALRDHARSRWDPMDGFADVVLFYEPLQSLEPEEKSFMAEMVREVIKSLVDVNPEFARVVNSGQIDRLIFEAHQKQLDDLQQKLDQKSARVKELLEVKQYLESQMAKGGKMAAPDNSVLAKYEQMMRLMEDQLGCLRVDFWNMQQDHQKLQQEQQQADAERAELARKLEKEQAENQVLQEEVTRLCGVEEGFKDTIQRMEIEKSNLKHSVHELQTRATHLNRALQRRAHHRTHEAPEHAGQEEAEEHDLALPSVVESGFEATRGAERESELVRERDAAIRARDQLQARCADLEKLLRAHAAQLSTLPAQQLEESAEELSQQAQNLGCSPSLVEKVRVCQCGNVLMQDAHFCRKCGGKWEGGAPPVSASSQTTAAQIVGLDSQIHELEQALGETTRELGESRGIEAFRTESVGGISQSISHLLRPKTFTTVEDLPAEPEVQKQRVETLRLRKDLDDLKQSKLQAEARLLSQRVEELSRMGSLPPDLGEEPLVHHDLVTGDPVIHGCDGVNCKYRREAEAAKEMIKALRALAAQLAEKLKLATGEHMQMSMALTTMQGSLEAAVQEVERDVREVELGQEVDLQQTLGRVSTSLQETKRRSVFWRLYQNRGRGRSHRQTSSTSATQTDGRQDRDARDGRIRRLDLLQQTYEQLYKVHRPFHLGEIALQIGGPTPILVRENAESVTPPPPMPALPERAFLRHADARRSTLPAVTPRAEKPAEKVPAVAEKTKGASLIVLGADFPKPPATPEPPKSWSQRRRR